MLVPRVEAVGWDRPTHSFLYGVNFPFNQFLLDNYEKIQIYKQKESCMYLCPITSLTNHSTWLIYLLSYFSPIDFEANLGCDIISVFISEIPRLVNSNYFVIVTY